MVQMGGAVCAQRGGSLADATYLGCMAALGAITMVAIHLGHKKKLTDEQIEEHGNYEMARLVNKDTVTLAALLVAKMTTSHDYKEENDGAALIGNICWGPRTFKAALDEWERMTGRSPDGVFDQRLLEAAKDAKPIDAPKEDPFQKWMESRKANVVQSPSSETKH